MKAKRKLRHNLCMWSLVKDVRSLSTSKGHLKGSVDFPLPTSFFVVESSTSSTR